MRHSQASEGKRHPAFNWQFADQAARLAFTGYDAPLAEDVYKLALQVDTETYWTLTDHSPVTWAGLGAGDVLGPGSATDNAIARFNGTTGKSVQNSAATVNDTGDVTAGLYNSVNVPALATAHGDHVADTANPHTVTPGQVGNGTAQWNADKLQGQPVDSAAPSLNDVPTWDGSKWSAAPPPGASGGEANTASNVGAGGVGLFKGKFALDLRFKNLNAGSPKVTVTDDVGNDEVDIDVDAGVEEYNADRIRSVNVDNSGLADGKTLRYNSTTTNLEYEDADTLSTQAQLLYLEVCKGSAGTIVEGQGVYIAGYDAGLDCPKVELAKADSAVTMPMAGVADESITNAAKSKMVVSGTISGLDTSMWGEHDHLYMSAATAGLLVDAKPTGAANLVQKVAEVARSDASNGKLVIFGAGRSNDLPNLTTGNLWLGDGSGVPVEAPLAGLSLDADQVAIERIGTPTYDDVQDSITVLGSSGAAAFSHITDAGGGNIDVAAGAGFVRTTDSHTGLLQSFDWAASSGIAIPSDVARYVGVEYNGGTPHVVVKTTDTWDLHTDFRLGSVINEGGTLHILDNPQVVANGVAHAYERMYQTQPFERANRTGGLIAGETGTRNLTMSAGKLFDGLNEFNPSAIDTSGADTFDYYYRDGVGGWTKQAAQTQWNNTQYDDNSGVLATLAGNKWGVHWLYIEADGDMVLVYGQAEYAKQSDAEEAPTPSTIPLRLQTHGTLLARLIFQESAGTAARIDSAFATVFSGAGVTSHLDLTDVGTFTHAQIDSRLGVKQVNFMAEANTNLGNRRVRSIGATASFNFSFDFPLDFGSIVDLVAVVIGSAGTVGVGKDIDLTSEYGKVGEARNNHAESDTTSTYTLPGLDAVATLDLSGVFSTPEAGDSAGVNIDHNSIGGTMYYQAIRLRYNTL